MVGIPLFLGADKTPGRAVTQVPGEAMRMKAAVFTKAITQSGPLVTVLHRYIQAFMIQVAQSAACNRAHSIEQRCARWLLMTHDWVESESFTLT